MALREEELASLDRLVRAANYLTVGQIYLQANPLLHEPLAPEHVKPRLLGHWGTSPGLSLIYAHLNRILMQRDLSLLYLTGPGHGGPAIVANVYLEGTYSEFYPRITRDAAGMLQLFRQFSTPGGVPSHVGPQTPGSIHEGGELGYVLTHAFGAVFDNPDVIAVAVVGDGEAETGPLEGSWKGIRFLNPARDGAVLPILHLNGYKIAGPTVLGRSSTEDVKSLLEGHGYRPIFVEGETPMELHEPLAEALERSFDEIASIQAAARKLGPAAVTNVPRWPAIVLRSPKGMTGPDVVDGKKVCGSFRSHQVPLSNVRKNPAALAELERWLKSYVPEELFDVEGRPKPELAALVPPAVRRMGASIHANGGKRAPLVLPDPAAYAIEVKKPGTITAESTRPLGALLRDVYVKNPTSFRLFCPDETNSNRLGAVFEVEKRCLIGTALPEDDRVGSEGRVMEILSEHNCAGWLEGYNLTGRHGVFATYEAFSLIVASMTTQHAKWLEACGEIPWRNEVPSLNYLLTSTCWRNDHNGFSHQGPGFIDTILSKKGSVARVYLPADGNTLLAVAGHVLPSHSVVNVVVIDKQPQLQWLDYEAAKEHLTRGASRWEFASTDHDGKPHVILACAGDIATQETIAAAAYLKKRVPELRVRVVNVVDLMCLFPPDAHPHGMTPQRFWELFTHDVHVVFAFHGYPGAVHQLLHGRPDADRFHVRGYREEGTTTTPFDMVVVNKMSRFHIAMDALKYASPPTLAKDEVYRECEAELVKHHAWVRDHFEDLPEVRDFKL
jgi:xylulose-5-phosphate/fructose-6-phosphate phosphoketolase